MSDADKSLKVHVGTTGDPSGAKAVDQSLKDVHQTVGKGNETLAEQLKLQTGINLEYGETRRVLEGLNQAIPGLVEGLRALTSSLGIVSLATAAFVEIRNQMAETEKAANEFAALMAEHFGNLREAITDAARDIANRTNEITINLKAIEEGERRITQQVNETTDAIKRREQAQIAQTDAQEALDLAKVQAERKLGLSDVDADRREAQIKAAAEQRRNQITTEAEQHQFAVKSTQAGQAYGDYRRNQNIVDKYAPTEAERTGRIKTLPEEQAGLEKQRDAIDKKIAEQQAKMDAASKISAEYDKYGVQSQDASLARERTESATKELQSLIDHKAAINQRIESAKTELSSLEATQKAFEEAKTSATKLKETATALIAETDAMKTTIAEADASRNALAKTHAETQQVNQLPDVYKDIAAGHGATAAAMSELRTMAQDALSSINKQLEITRAAHGNTVDLKQRQDALIQEINALNKAIKTTTINGSRNG